MGTDHFESAEIAEIMVYRIPIPALLCFMVLFSGCAGERERAITFAVGGTPSQLAYWEKLVERFETEKSIRVVLLRQPAGSDQRRQGLVISLAARHGDPDVFLMDVVWIAQFAASGWLAPLDENAKQDKLDLTAFFPRIVNLADMYGGRLVALPMFVDGGVLYYRKDMIEEWGFSAPPETWDELVRFALAIQQDVRKTVPRFYGFVWQGAQYEGLVCNFLEVAASNGGGIGFSDGRIILSTPENLEALSFMCDLVHRHRISPPSVYTEMKEEEARLAFQRGTALFERNWPYAWMLHQSPDSAVKRKTGIAILPHFASGKSVSALGGGHLGISQFSDKKALAWELVKYLVSREIQKEITLELGLNPARKDLYDDPEVLSRMPHFARLRDVFEHALPRPVVPYYSQLSEVIQRHISSALAGTATPGQALALAEKDAQRIVERYEGKRKNP
jgi:multiple sugar transport system substrate-binding protein